MMIMNFDGDEWWHGHPSHGMLCMPRRNVHGIHAYIHEATHPYIYIYILLYNKYYVNTGKTLKIRKIPKIENNIMYNNLGTHSHVLTINALNNYADGFPTREQAAFKAYKITPVLLYLLK